MKDNRRRHIPPINEQIPFNELQLIAADGQNVGVTSKVEALGQARAAGLDLVLLVESGGEGVPVVKIMDYGKVLYEKKKKTAESKRRQKVHQLKEIKMRPKIGEHDYQTKINQAIKFLREGKKLKVTLMFRGREMATREERGTQMFERVEQAFKEAKLNVAREKESRMGYFWTRMYYVKR